MTATIPPQGISREWGSTSAPPEWAALQAPVAEVERNPFQVPETPFQVEEVLTPDPEPASAPLTLSHGQDALSIVIRSPKPPEGDSWSWWTPDATDDVEWDERAGWYQIGYALKTPVWLEESPDRSAPKPKVVKFYRDMSFRLAEMHGGQVLQAYKNPDAPHVRYPIHTGRRSLFDLKEIKKMTMTPQDLARAGGQSRSPKKTRAVQKNLEAANDGKAKAAAKRYARVLKMVDGGVSVDQLADWEDISPDSAQRLIRRAKAWRAEQ